MQALGQVQRGSGEGAGGAEPGQVQQGSGEGFGAGRGGFGAGPGQVQLNRVPEKVLEKVPEKVWEALVRSQVRFSRVPEKVPETVCSVQSQVRLNRVQVLVFGAEPGHFEQGSGRRFR